MKKVLVTGAAGAFGKAVIEKLKVLNVYEIYAIIFNNLELMHDTAITCYQCDLVDYSSLAKIFDLVKPDLVLHLGAIFSGSLVELYNTNVQSTIYLLNLIKQQNTNARLVIIGSAAEYGVVQPDANPISEDRFLYPVSNYGVSKAWQTQLMGAYVYGGVDIVCARVFNLYGPNISNRLFFGVIQNKISAIKAGAEKVINIGNLSAVRDYLSLDTASDLLLRIAHNGISGNVYHIASGVPISMKALLLQQLELHGMHDVTVQEASGNSNHLGYDVPVIYANMDKTNSLRENLCRI